MFIEANRMLFTIRSIGLGLALAAGFSLSAAAATIGLDGVAADNGAVIDGDAAISNGGTFTIDIFAETPTAPPAVPGANQFQSGAFTLTFNTSVLNVLSVDGVSVTVPGLGEIPVTTAITLPSGGFAVVAPFGLAPGNVQIASVTFEIISTRIGDENILFGEVPDTDPSTGELLFPFIALGPGPGTPPIVLSALFPTATVSFTAQPIPLPASVALMLVPLAAGGLVATRRRRKA